MTFHKIEIPSMVGKTITGFFALKRTTGETFQIRFDLDTGEHITIREDGTGLIMETVLPKHGRDNDAENGGKV